MNAAATPFMELRNDITSSFRITLDFDMDNVNLKHFRLISMIFLISMYDGRKIFHVTENDYDFLFYIYLR